MSQADEMRDYKGAQTCEPSKRTWPVTAVGLLLLLQGAGLFGLGAIYFARVYLLDLWVPMSALSAEELLWMVISEVSMSIIFIPLSLLAILIAASFLHLRPHAWTNAMLLQGLTLLIALILYFTDKPFYVYILMLYSIFIVLYLNYSEVQVTCRSQSMIENREEIHPGGEHCGGDR